MDSITYGIIEPGKRIGEFYIGSSKEEVISALGSKYQLWTRNDGFCIYTFSNFKLWFDENGRLIQIGVTKGFLDGYNNIFIGSTMKDVVEIYGSYENDDVQYLLPDVDGICFELEDVDDWDELTAPIEWIFVYKC